MSKTITIDQLAKELLKVTNKEIDNVKKAMAKAANSTARKIRTEIVKQEKKILKFKNPKRFKNAIKITKATKDNPTAQIKIPDNANEIHQNGKTYLMIPAKSYLKKIGIAPENITKNTAASLLHYAGTHPFKTRRHTTEPKAFFKLESSKTGQKLISARKKESRNKMNWFFAGREGKDLDFEKIIKDVADKNLEKDFERELNKLKTK